MPVWKTIFLENAYYAIKSMELIVDHCELGSLSDLNFSKQHLYNYINSDIIEIDDYIYFQPKFIDSPEYIIEYTYYAIYILKQLNLYGLDSLKVKNYILDQIQYENLKSLYYAYKISELLDIDFELDQEASYDLVQKLYDEETNEFHHQIGSNRIDQDAFYYVVELGNKSPLEIKSIYKNPIFLGNTITIQTTFQNLMLKEFAPTTLVKMISHNFGEFYYERNPTGYYQISFSIPCEPDYLPVINATIMVYLRGRLLGDTIINIRTQLNDEFSHRIIKDNKTLFLELNYSRRSSTGYINTENCNVYADILNGSHFHKRIILAQKNFLTHSTYSLNKTFISDGYYKVKIYLVDEFFPNSKLLLDTNITVLTPLPDTTNSKNTITITGPAIAFVGLIMTGITVGLIYKTGNWVKLRKHRKLNKNKSKSQIESSPEKPLEEELMNNINMFEKWNKK